MPEDRTEAVLRLPPRRAFTLTESSLAHHIAGYIRDRRAARISNEKLLIEIDHRWPELPARILIAAHFLDLHRNQFGGGALQ